MFDDDFDDGSEYKDPRSPEPEPVRPTFSVSRQVNLLATGQARDVLRLQRETFDSTLIGVRLADAEGQTRIELAAGDRPKAALLGLMAENDHCLSLPTKVFNAYGGTDIPVGYRAALTFRTRHMHESEPGYVEEYREDGFIKSIEQGRKETLTVTTTLHFIANKGLPYQQRSRLAALPD